jgi:prepilin-type N-terminal cleavage/methylation domain-containing protein
MTARAKGRPGYTLMEAMLVVAVIALLAAICVPSLKGMYGYYKLNGAVDSVRSAWAHARARAIEEGRPYRFAVVADAGSFRVAPDQADYWGGSPPADDPHGKGFVLEQSLPKGVHFTLGGDSQAPGVGGTPADGEEDVPGDLAAGRKDQNHASLDAYTTAAVFLPDGTARDDVKIVFQVRGAQPTAIQLRGMTGSVTVKKLNR